MAHDSSLGMRRFHIAYEQHKQLTDMYLKGRTIARGSLWTLGGKGHHSSQEARGWPVVDGQFFETVAHRFRVPRRAGVPESPIPREAAEVIKRLKD